METIDLLTRQRDAAEAALRAAREAWEAVRARIAELGDEPTDEAERAAYAETARTLAEELETTGQALEDAHAEYARIQGNLEAEERRAAIPEPDRRRPEPTPRGGARAELVYRPDRHSFADFARDVYAVQFAHRSDAAERLVQHERQMADVYRERFGREMRDVGTGALSGFTIPQYLVDEYAPLARAGAPFLAALAGVRRNLPEEGMVINIPRGTTGTAVAAQAAENAAVQETDFDDTLMSVPIRQYPGQNDLSRQAVERSRDAVDTIFADLIADWWTKVDAACLNADGTAGTVLGLRSVAGINSITYTDASPTVGEFYPKFAGAKEGIVTNRHAPPLLALMHGRRWEWIMGTLDSAGRPLAVPNAQGPFNALAVGDAPEYGAVVGTIQGLPVVTDNNIPTNLGAGTNEDVVIVTRPQDHRLWLDPAGGPRTFTFEQANAPQSVRLAVWGEVAFTGGRYPAATSVIGGTGLVAPSF
jgi:HK97 family phage major capsid protein